MDYFEMERKAMQGKRAKNSIANNNSKLQESYNNMIEKRNQDSLIEEYDFLTEQKNNINRAGFGLIGTNSSIRRRVLNDKRIYQEELQQKLFINSVYDIFMEALLLDDDFKNDYAGNLYQLVEETTNQLMQERGVTMDSILKHGSLLMQNIVYLCEETAKDQADAKYNVKDIKNKEVLNEKNKKIKDGDLIDRDSKRVFDCEKEYDTQTIAEAIRDKVVAVVRKEQEMAEEEREVDDEIKSQTGDLGELDRRTQDELGKDVHGLPKDDMEGLDPLEDEGNSTRDIERLSMSPSLGAGSDHVSDDEIEDGHDSNSDNDDDPKRIESMILHSRKLRKSGIIQESLFKSLQMNIARKTLTEQKLSESGVQLNMDMVFAEALAYYTLLETLHTARIIEFKPSEARKMAKEFSYNSRK